MKSRHNIKWVLNVAMAGMLLPVLVQGQEERAERPPRPRQMQEGGQMDDRMRPGDGMREQGMRGRGEMQMRERDQERPDMMREILSRHPGIRPDEVMKFIQEQFPEEMQKVHEFRPKNPREAEEVMAGLLERAVDLMELRQRSPEQFEKALRKTKLDRETELMASRLRSGAVENREAILKEMRSALEQSFELKQELMKMTVEGLDKEVQELKGMIEKRQANKNAMIERRMQELTGKGSDLTW